MPPQPPAAPADRSVAVVGLGLLGGALARRLQAHGWTVSGYDPDPAARNRAAAAGIAAVASLDDLSLARCVLLSLPDAGVSGHVLDQLLPRMLGDGGCIVDTTTGGPDEMAALGARAGAAGVRYLDACVGGSSVQAERGEAVLMVGGDAEAFRELEELWSVLARQTFYVGPAGSGSRMKLVTNLVLGLNRAVLAEGLALAEAFELDPQQTLDILQAGPAASQVMVTKGSKMLARDFTPQARLSQHLKDVRLILAAAADRDRPLPLTSLHRELLEEAERRGAGALDNSAIRVVYDADET